jgi:flagellar assembly protein FliH
LLLVVDATDGSIRPHTSQLTTHNNQYAMPLIKSPNTPLAATPFSLADVERAAKVTLLRARQQAEQLLAAAQAEGEALKLEAHAQGLAQGQAEGMAQGLEQGKQTGQQQALNEHRAQLQQAIAALTKAATTLDASRMDLEANALSEVVKLAVAIARRVTKRQGLLDPAVLTSNLAEAMKLVIQSTDVRVAIHPAQRATLDGAMPQLRLEWPNLAHVQIIEDLSLTAGSCRVFTEQGEIDAELAGQLDRIVAELLPTPEHLRTNDAIPGKLP